MDRQLVMNKITLRGTITATRMTARNRAIQVAHPTAIKAVVAVLIQVAALQRVQLLLRAANQITALRTIQLIKRLRCPIAMTTKILTTLWTTGMDICLTAVMLKIIGIIGKED